MNWENNYFSPLTKEQTKKHQEQSIKTDCFGISSDSSNLDDAILIKPDYFFFLIIHEILMPEENKVICTS